MDDTDIFARLAISIRDRELARKHAQTLQELGFNIVKTASRGVSFTGSAELFQKTFNWEIETTDSGVHALNEPSIPEELGEETDSIYIPTKPLFFKS